MYTDHNPKERYEQEAARNRARFAAEGVRVLVGDASERYPLPEMFREVFVRPAIRGHIMRSLRRD